MFFWIFMLICALLIPLTMILFGWLFMTKAPRNINFAFGYRTEMSMKNRDTWEFAHRYCGRLWLRIGLVLLPLSVVPMILVFGNNEDIVGTVGGVLTLLQIIPLIGPIFPTERALRKNFDRYGRPRSEIDDD